MQSPVCFTKGLDTILNGVSARRWFVAGLGDVPSAGGHALIAVASMRMNHGDPGIFAVAGWPFSFAVAS